LIFFYIASGLTKILLLSQMSQKSCGLGFRVVFVSWSLV